MRYNVAVIGAGTAGLMAARELAKTKVNFIVIDSKKKIGLPLKCGEGVRKKGFLELFGKKTYSFVKNDIKKCIVTSGKTKRGFKADYLILDRPRFEQWLAKSIKNKIKLQTKCIDISRKKDYLEIITNKGKLYADLAILCNGINYTIQKKFGLLSRPPYLIPCYGGIFTAKNIDKKTIYFFFEDTYCTGLWLFPKENNKANVGIAVMPHGEKANLKDMFNRAIKNNNLQLKGKASYGGSFPTTGPIKKTYTDRLLVCGNAAGQVYAGSGEGIYFALKSGQLAGKTAAEAVEKNNFKASFLKNYEKKWKKAFRKQLDTSLAFTRILFLGFKYKKLEKLFAFPSEKHIADMLFRGKTPLSARFAVLLDKVFEFSRR